MTPDPRLVAAMAEAIQHAETPVGATYPPIEPYIERAAAILPAFLADPRTHEWLAERLHGNPSVPMDSECIREAAAILGVGDA